MKKSHWLLLLATATAAAAPFIPIPWVKDVVAAIAGSFLSSGN